MMTLLRRFLPTVAMAGVENGVEWFLGGNANTSGFTALPAVANTGGTLSVTWTKSADYPGTYGTGFRVETSATLANPWTPATEGVGAGFVEITGNNVKFTFPAGVKNFARLVVTGILVLAADPVAGQPKLQPGLDYEFYGSTTLEGVGDSGSALDVGPMGEGREDWGDWGIRFTGLLMPPADGEYAFRAEADTGLLLYLDGKPVIDGWALNGARTGKVTLKKANPADITVMYFFDRSKGGKKAELRLFWTPPGGQEEPVPVTAYARIVDVPKVSPWKRIAFDPSFGGAWVVAGDVDGDGEVEIITARNINTKPVNADDFHSTCTAAAYKLNGKQLWSWGQPGAGRAELGHDVACQIHDWDGDGRLEVVVAEAAHLVVLEGATGRELRRIPLPNPSANLSDCLTFADLRGVGRPTDVLVKDRYRQIWALDPDGKVLWNINSPYGARTAHQPWVHDLDRNGRDEVMAGAVMLNSDGSWRWKIQLPNDILPYKNDDGMFEAGPDGFVRPDDILTYRWGHLDCIRLLRDAARPEDQRLAFTYCGSHLLGVMDGTGKVLWTKTGEHFESIDIARVIPGEPDPQIVVDLDLKRKPREPSPLLVYSQDGQELSRFHTRYSRSHRPIRWRSGDVADIVVSGARMIYSGHGEPIAELVVEGADIPFMSIVCDLTGDGYDDILINNMNGTAAYLYRNPRVVQPDRKMPLGSGFNVTLY